ncbi:amidohydrolase family protein [Acidipila sp. EB88]|uniref:metal-dependent hydrolase family protein n=1 Tax=Acidipila sp. EB88 TaxID=2305226 RepID=UPI00131535D6|nr:amidohydrolase family protein [Acidipila sp. EB88]
MPIRFAQALVASALLLLAGSTLHAQSAPAAPPHTQAVLAGRLIDVRTGQITTRAYIVLNDERIVSVSTNAPAAGVPITDLSRYTLVPGLIDAHAHILSDPTTQSSASYLLTSAPQATIRGVANLQLWSKHGFTVVRDACESYPSYPQFALREGVQKKLISGPRILAAGSCVSLTGGHGDSDRLSPDKPSLDQPNQVDTVDDVSRIVRRDIKYGADWIKLMATGGVMDPISDYRVQELSDEQMARAVQEAHRAGRKVMAHAEGTLGIKAAVMAGVDSIEHGTLLDDEGAMMMAQRGTWLVPTLYCFQHDIETGLSKGREPASMAKGIAIVKEQGPAFQRALKYHLKIAYGVDDADIDESVSKEFGALVRGGMTPLQALQAATINGALLLSLDHDLGAIEPGKYADLVAVPGNPLDDITAMEHVAWVMQAGTVLKPLTPNP